MKHTAWFFFFFSLVFIPFIFTEDARHFGVAGFVCLLMTFFFAFKKERDE